MATGYTPIYKVMKGDVDVTDRFNDRTTQIKVEHSSQGGEGDKCVIRIDDRDWKVARPFPGDTLSIWMGYEEIGYSYMGSFQINDVTFLGMPRSIQLTGLSTGMRDIQKAPQIKSFENKSVSDILQSIAGQTGLTAMIDSSLGSMKIPFKNQVTSNLHLIHEIERLTGATAKIADGKLSFIKRDGTTSASGIEMPTLVLQPEHFGNWQVQYSSRADYGGVKAAYFDKDQMVRKWVNSSAAGGTEGADPFIIGNMFNSLAEATAAANSRMEALNRAEVHAIFDLAKGDPWIKDTQTLIVSGMRDGVNGSYVIEKAIHTYIKNTGIRSQLECRSPGNGADFSDRAEEYFLKPLGNETLGELLAQGIVPKDITQIAPFP